MGMDGDPVPEFDEFGTAWGGGSDFFDLEAHRRLEALCHEFKGLNRNELQKLKKEFIVTSEDTSVARVRIKTMTRRKPYFILMAITSKEPVSN